MRKHLSVLIILLFPFTVLAGETLKLKVQKSALYEEPKFFSRSLALVQYGDSMEKIREQKDWVFVRFGDQQGWIHKSAVTSSTPALGTVFFGSSPAPETSDDEVALAGKGFTPEVEKGYGKNHPEMKYALVDEIEGYKVEQKSLAEFIQQGGLKASEVW